ncbi:MAG: hypothetical protein A2143_05930 [Gallionellales bacterium RBG_16_57_15]|nr:MAG: hypothetical protein A2143_05930 [Gallionellales bacterium RBG_16_57_15]
MCGSLAADIHNFGSNMADPITRKIIKKNTDWVRDKTGWDAETGERHGAPEPGDDPAAEAQAAQSAAESARRKVEQEATAKANQDLLAQARRKRAQKGLLSTEAGMNILASGNSSSSNVLGSGGA